MTFSEKVKHVRTELGYSQEELARKLEISFATVNRWKSGLFNPSQMALKLFNMFCEDNSIKFE